MPIIVPTQQIIISREYEDYAFPLSILQEQFLTTDDEEIMQAMAKYRPLTRIKPNDFVLLTEVPAYLKYRETVPRCWKVRFVITEWAWNLMRIVAHYGNHIGLDRAITLLEANRSIDHYRYRKPLIYAHGYPHGEYPDSAAWLPEQLLKRTVFNETQMQWVDIVEQAGADYLGYDTARFPTRYTLDFAPDDYSHGNNIGRPFTPEEPLVNTLYFAGMEEMLEVPFVVGEEDRVRRIEPDHDIFETDAEDDEILVKGLARGL